MAYNTDNRQQSNRLHLNFGFNNPPNFGQERGQAFPTTPSTFPQPFPNAAGQQEVWGTQPASSGVSNQGYFYNNPAPFQSQSQSQSQSQYQHNVPSPGAGYRSPGGYNDGTNGLVHQFSHQNLGGANTPRSASPYGRQPSPGGQSRPRTGGAPGQQPQYGSYLNAPMPHSQVQQPSIYDDEPPVKNAERYSMSIVNRAKLQTELAGQFFKENVERARDRNGRFVLTISHTSWYCADTSNVELKSLKPS